MIVNLTPQLEELVQKEVESGRYNSASEVVREALRLLEQREEARSTQLEDIHRHMDRALAEADRGECTDGEEFMQSLLFELDQKHLHRAG